MQTKGFLSNSYSFSNTESTRRHYDDWAESYESELTDNDYSQPSRCCDALKASGLTSNAQILDVGCGTGLAALAAGNAGFRCIDGCDFSSGMLAKARTARLYRHLFTADLNRPPMDIPDNTYDAALVVGVFSFGHVNAEAMDEVLRVVKINAPVIVGINDKYYRENSLLAKLKALEQAGTIDIVSQEAGDHLPGIDLSGWVFSLRKRRFLV